MTKEFWTHTSIVFDSAAYFLITIDLYGEHRLLALQAKLKRIKSPQVLEVILRLLDLKWWPNILLYSSGVIVGGIFYYQANKYVQNYLWFNNHTLVKHTIVFLISCVVWGLFQFIVFFLFYVIVMAITNLTRSILLMLKTKSVKFWMIPVGTIFFISSKIISWIYN